MPDPGPGAETVGPRRLVGDRVHVLDAVQDLDQYLPERGVHDQQEDRAQFRAVQQDGERDQGDGGDRTEELDGGGGDFAEIRHHGDQHPRHDPRAGGDGEAQRPAGQRVAERRPEGGVGEFGPEGVGDPAGRREVLLLDQAEPRHRLAQGEEDREPGRAEHGVQAPHESSLSRSGVVLNSPSRSPSSISFSMEPRSASAGHFGRVTCSSTAGGILVYVVTIWRTSSGWASA